MVYPLVLVIQYIGVIIQLYIFYNCSIAMVMLNGIVLYFYWYSLGIGSYYKYPTALAPTYGRWAPVAHGGALPFGAGAPHRGAIMPHLCVMC